MSCLYSALSVAVSAIPADREVVSEFPITMLDAYVPKAGEPIKQNKCMFSVSSGRQYCVKGNDVWCSNVVKKDNGYYGHPTYWEMAPAHDITRRLSP